MSGVLATAALKMFMMFLPSVLHFIITSTLHLKVRSGCVTQAFWGLTIADPNCYFLPIKTFTVEFEPRNRNNVFYSFQLLYMFFGPHSWQSAVYFSQPENSMWTGGKRGTIEVAAMGHRFFGFVCGSGDLFGTWSYHHLLHCDAGGNVATKYLRRWKHFWVHIYLVVVSNMPDDVVYVIS